MMRRALDIDERNFPPDHDCIATDLRMLAEMLACAGKVEEAEPLMQRALDIDQNLSE
jgi:hypothetical protein